MASYRFLCHDLRTNQFLGEVPAGRVEWTEEENAVSSLSFTVDLAEQTTSVTIDPMRLGGQYRDMLRPGRTKVTPLRDGNPYMGSHIVWTRSYDGRSLAVQCGGMWSYFTADGGAEPLWQDKTFTLVDQHDIARTLITFAQQGHGNIGMLLALNDSGVLRTETYEGRELARVGTRVDELANRRSGFEFSVTTAMVDGVPVSTWRPWYPRRGRRASESGLTFTLGHNLRAYSLTENPPTTTFRAFGAGEGTAMLQYAASEPSYLSQGYPALVRASGAEYKDVGRMTSLVPLADRALEQMNEEALVWTLELVDPDDVSTPFGSWQVGDDAKIVIPPDLDDFYPEGVEVTKRIIGQTVSIPDDGGPEAITLTMGAARG